MLRAAVRASDGVDLQRQIGHAHRSQKIIADRDDLRVRYHIRCAERFHAELVELSQTSGLRLFITEARNIIIQLDRLHFRVQFVLDESAYGRRSSFRLQSNGASAVIVERVHFFLYNVCGITDASLE